MGSNTFGKLFQFTTWGESHGKAIGVVIDGCPAGLPLGDADINTELSRRAPGKNPFTSPRKEEDKAEIYSGIFEGKTTGAPISIIIPNQDADSSKYEPIKELCRPGHANVSYLKKYGVFDYRGGGRASARETACRVAAGAVAKKLLNYWDIEVIAFLKELGGIQANPEIINPETVYKSPLYCPDRIAEKQMIELLEKVRAEGDSLGGVVEVRTDNLPAGLGDPIYDKLDAILAQALLSIPATKGFEIGSGFMSASMKGSEHNDLFACSETSIYTESNHAGGVSGGISTGMPLIARVCFKPASSIKIPQKTVTLTGKNAVLTMPEGSRHDPCVAIRGVPVVEAMTALVLADALLASMTNDIERMKLPVHCTN